MYELPGAMTSC